MFKPIVALALACAPAPFVMRAEEPPARVHHPDRPPARFLRDGAVAVVGFADPDTVHELCAQGEPLPAGTRILACVMRRPDGAALMFLPNPCRHEGFYAELACHEMGHVNGWGPEHRQEEGA